ncbi:MAG: hypothetical protein KDB63_18100 [Nocardioidaceae bacterium]|nr:hypothetical protein [Nocardioidaceae bacterium]
MRSVAREERPGVDSWLARIVAVVTALLVMAPTLGPGRYTLVSDMVFVSAPALSARSWGADGSVPRAVPMDALLALASHVLPMWLVQQVLLLAIVGLAVLGAWRVSPARTIPGAAAGALAFGWTPYTAERLAMGHWSLLLGVALLPWILLAAIRFDGGREPLAPRAPWALVLLVAAGAVAAPTAGVLTGGLALALIVLPRFRSRDRVVLVASVVVFNATWVLPGALADALTSTDPRGVAAFAVSPDTPWGGVVSLATGGGLWNTLTHPTSRGIPVAVAGSLVLLAIGLLGWSGSRAWWDEPATRARGVVAGLALVGLLVGLASLTPAGRDLLVWTTGHVPGGGILRDAQKWVAWWVLAVSLGVGPALERLTRPFSAREATFLVGCGAVLPLIVLPDLAWGVNGRLVAHRWPDDYAAAAQVVNESAAPGAALVLPWHAFRAWSWNDQTTVLDPWSRLLDRRTIVRDDLEVRAGVVPGEDPEAAWVTARLAAGELTPEALRQHGVRFVVEDLTTAGQDPGTEPAGEVVFEGRWIRVVDLGPVTGALPVSGHVGAVLTLDLAAGIWLIIALVGNAEERRRRVLCFAGKSSRGRQQP